MDSSLSHRGGGGGLNAFYWNQIFALDSVVVKTQKCLARMEASNTVYHHRETIKLTHYDETKKRAHDVGAKGNLKLSYGGPSQGQASGTNQRIKALRQGRHKPCI